MVLDEKELRHQLVAAADGASAPRLSIDGLTRRIRRRRGKVFGLVGGAVLAVAVIAVAIPAGLGGGSSQPARPWVIPFRLSYKVTVNGLSRALPKNGPPPSFSVTPGEKLEIGVDVTVPAHAAVTALWLGIAGDTSGVSPSGPTGVHPILAHVRRPLTPGPHSYTLRWTAPAGARRGSSLNLNATWAAGRRAMVGQTIASLVMTGS